MVTLREVLNDASLRVKIQAELEKVRNKENLVTILRTVAKMAADEHAARLDDYLQQCAVFGGP